MAAMDVRRDAGAVGYGGDKTGVAERAQSSGNQNIQRYMPKEQLKTQNQNKKESDTPC